MNKGEIVLAGGCFWGTEAYLKRLPGIIQTEVGYANSSTPQPSYEEVCSGETGAAEAVRVIYDKEVISLPLLLEAYLRTVDPTSLNRQGNDRGTQYRTGIYWTDERDEPIVVSELGKVERRIGRRVRVEACPLQSFYPAEPYHQNYLDANPLGYCHVNLADAADFVSEHAADFAIAQHDYSKPADALLETMLDPTTFAVTQQGGDRTCLFTSL